MHWFLKFILEVKLYMFRTGSGWNCSSIMILLESCLQTCMTYTIAVWLLSVRWETPDDGQRDCPKHVELHSKIKFEKISASSWFYYKDLSRCTVTWA
jgi:hypothetical protein